MAPTMNTFFAISTAVVLSTSTVFASLLPRNDGPTAPPCSVPFTPYLYAGCYTDSGSPRALPFGPDGLDRQNMTIETCVAECKGELS